MQEHYKIGAHIPQFPRDRQKEMLELRYRSFDPNKLFPYPGVSPNERIVAGDYVKLWINPEEEDLYSDFYIKVIQDWLYVKKIEGFSASGVTYYTVVSPKYPHYEFDATWEDIQRFKRSFPPIHKSLTNLPSILL